MDSFKVWPRTTVAKDAKIQDADQQCDGRGGLSYSMNTFVLSIHLTRAVGWCGGGYYIL